MLGSIDATVCSGCIEWPNPCLFEFFSESHKSSLQIQPLVVQWIKNTTTGCKISVGEKNAIRKAEAAAKRK